MKVFPSEMIEIVGVADTIIVHFQLQCTCITYKQQYICVN